MHRSPGSYGDDLHRHDQVQHSSTSREMDPNTHETDDRRWAPQAQVCTAQRRFISLKFWGLDIYCAFIAANIEANHSIICSSHQDIASTSLADAHRRQAGHALHSHAWTTSLWPPRTTSLSISPVTLLRQRDRAAFALLEDFLGVYIASTHQQQKGRSLGTADLDEDNRQESVNSVQTTRTRHKHPIQNGVSLAPLPAPLRQLIFLW